VAVVKPYGADTSVDGRTAAATVARTVTYIRSRRRMRRWFECRSSRGTTDCYSHNVCINHKRRTRPLFRILYTRVYTYTAFPFLVASPIVVTAPASPLESHEQYFRSSIRIVVRVYCTTCFSRRER